MGILNLEQAKGLTNPWKKERW